MKTPKQTKRVVKRLGWLKFVDGEIYEIAVQPKNTVFLGSFGDSIPCKITITYEIPNKKKKSDLLKKI